MPYNRCSERPVVSIESLLAELVSSVEGATGAIVLDADGEAVGFYSAEGECTRLRGAYVSLMLRDLRASKALNQLGSMRGMVIEYEGASLVAKQIDDDCIIVLELALFTNISEAMFRLASSAQLLRRELT
jgi:predicted regulator of Ras-like GTPase activity (Roadblock/LC7/MglB family)